MKTKIEIKSYLGAVLFEYESDENTLKKTIERAVLQGADLRDADLRDAVLQGAVLQHADLQGAVLRGADLRDADLRDADLTPIRDDFWAVLSAQPREVAGLRKAIVEGRINGSSYEGDCACLVGTIANEAKCNFKKLEYLKPDSSRPIERFFMGIKIGDTPKDNPVSKIALEWLDQWVDNVSQLVTNAKV